MKRICKICALCALLMLLTAAALAEGVLTLPSDLTTIGAEAFAGLQKVERINVPEGVTSIGPRAFADSSVKEVYVPSSVVRISDDALEGCANAKFISDGRAWHGVFQYTVNNNTVTIQRYMGTQSAVTVPAEVGGMPVTAIGTGAFTDNATLTKVVIPEGVTHIHEHAFSGCLNLTDITFPSTLQTFDQKVFINCGKNAKAPFYFVLPDNMEDMVGNNGGAHTFESCDAILQTGKTSQTAALLTDRNYTYTVAGERDFRYRYTYDRDADARRLYLVRFVGTGTAVSIPSGAQVIGAGAFRGCSALRQVVIPEGVTLICDSAFWDCVNLTDITFPKTLKRMEQKAFLNCGKSATAPFYFVLPDNMEDMVGNNGGAHTFESCDAILQTGKYSQTAKLLTDRNYDYTVDGERDYRYRYNYDRDADVRRLYLVRFVGTGTAASIPTGVEVIDAGAFRDCAALKKVTIPEGVTYIRDSAFAECVNLTDITFPSTLQYFDQKVFLNCGKNATSPFYFILPDNMKDLVAHAGGAYTFEACDAILQTGKTSQTAALLTDRNYAYTVAGERDYRYRYVAEKDGEETVRRLYLVGYAGTGTEANIPKGIYGILRFKWDPPYGEYDPGFFGSEVLEKVVIPEGTVFIGDSAFMNCPMLTDITLPSTIRVIENHAFENTGHQAGRRFIVALPAGIEQFTANNDSGWACFNRSAATLVAPKGSYVAQALYDNWWVYYNTVEDAQKQRNLCYKPNDDPDFKYLGNR